MLVSFAFRFITNSFAFWTSDARGLLYLTNTVILFFSGFIVPIELLSAVARCDRRSRCRSAGWPRLPIDVYLGKMAGAVSSGRSCSPRAHGSSF